MPSGRQQTMVLRKGSVKVAIARAEVLAVSLKLGGYYDSHIIEGVPAVATPCISISGGGDIVRVDVRIAALEAELALTSIGAHRPLSDLESAALAAVLLERPGGMLRNHEP